MCNSHAPASTFTFYITTDLHFAVNNHRNPVKQYREMHPLVRPACCPLQPHSGKQKKRQVLHPALFFFRFANGL